MEKRFFDSHTHLNDGRYSEARRTALADEIAASDVSHVVDVGFDLESSLLATRHARQYPWCYAAVGCHPHDAGKLDEETLTMFAGLAKKEKVVAIGEIGLDYYRDLSSREDQRYWFRRQLDLALALEMPVVIHEREAGDDVMRILKEAGVFEKRRTDLFPAHPDGGPDARLVLHCFSGGRETAEHYVRLGATLSVAGPITFRNARRPVEVVGAIPRTRLLIETDAPYLTPEPFRGKPNRSPLVRHTADKVAEIWGVSVDEAARVTRENARRFFGV